MSATPAAEPQTGPEPTNEPAPAARTLVEPGRRDPAGRRQAMIDAAAELIVEVGPDRLTHRRVAERAGVSLGSTTQYFTSLGDLREAAFAQLAEEIENSLEEIEAMMHDIATAPEHIARNSVEFLTDRRKVHADLALVAAAMSTPQFKAMGLRWYDRLVEILSAHVGQERATIIAVFLDGATMHAAQHEQPLSYEQLARTIRALFTLPIDGTPTHTDHTSATNETIHP